MQNGDFELVHYFESTVNELHAALYFASLAASIAEIHLYVCVFSPAVTLYTLCKLDLVGLCKNTDDELSVALCCTSMAVTVSKIRSLKYENTLGAYMHSLHVSTHGDTLYTARNGIFSQIRSNMYTCIGTNAFIPNNTSHVHTCVHPQLHRTQTNNTSTHSHTNTLSSWHFV